MKKLFPLFFICFFIVNVNLTFAKMKVGVVEFEEISSIGLKNASKIIPALLSEELVKLGKYEITERLLLANVLKEQELAVSGIVDTKSAPRIGKIYGLEGVITGSYMKIGDTISISARLIKTETGKVITAGTVKLKNLDDLENKIEILAYLLSGISREKMKVEKDIKEREKNKYGIIIGSGYFSCSEYNNAHFAPIMIGLFYGSKNIRFIFTGAPPLSQAALLEIGLDINISYYLAIGVRFNYTFSSGVKIKDEQTIHSIEYSTPLMGFTFIPLYNLSIGIYMGPMMSAQYNIYDKNGYSHKFKVKNCMDFPPPTFNIAINWSFSKNFGIRALMMLLGGDGKNIDTTSDWNTEWIDSIAITTGITYRFSFTSLNK